MRADDFLCVCVTLTESRQKTEDRFRGGGLGAGTPWSGVGGARQVLHPLSIDNQSQNSRDTDIAVCLSRDMLLQRWCAGGGSVAASY